ncbi:protein rhomboid-like [Pectinophora gossypiella]|uniref:protein rhomboid-like n=1 Tax=Pectinophora gossypiella TaxID=13191 RepID=UPI00214E4220|nr:protein rhomboid-like [Pectinophora gossypiella]XP_049867217.1 protein rhomboid-like [Pectinophora gossypiella]XP_049867218.1 protein rhomboid-like [Pectinophora gossypiella]XP_049867219.1 protein rhomboid-like [Pectinophora gossypiella]XP_049867220.1 protein rhomboid-like [Pectinophora gossypiella]XP_049867221.1 protein rhomboid-like [Pectinophora gossypiella]XP_049867222.1 protein rhomboid-like [Pectinophora gossypiella]
MAPNALDCEQLERQQPLVAGVHAGRRVRPPPAAPAAAWSEPAAETRLLLAPATPPVGLDAGLTLAVPAHHDRYTKCTLAGKFGKPLEKTKNQKRKEKLVAALKPPYFILSMIAVMTGVHMWAGEETRALLEWSPASWRHEPWRLVTYGWVHASAAHVALNALVGLAVGWRLEREQGGWRAAALWAGGVAAGALGAGALQPRVRVVGASAAVYALLTAHLPNVCLRFGHIPLWWFRPLSVVVLAASEASWALLRAPGAAAAAPRDHVAWAAHIFGAAVGVPLAFLVFTGENAHTRHVRWLRAGSLATLAAGGAAAAVYYSHCARAPPS